MQQLFAVTLAGFAQTRGSEPEARWYLLPEPSFAPHPVTFPIKKAERTVLVPAIGCGPEVQIPGKEEFQAANPDEAALRQRAGENANAILSSLQPEWVRNKKSVIEYGILQADYPLVAAVLTAPDLAKRFTDVLGPKILVVVPNRYTMYLFPALASRYEDYIDTFKAAFRATPYPVSLELFEVSESGIRAIGTFE